MASTSAIRGGVSELTVQSALMSRGWDVSKPLLDEKYDLVAHEPGTPPNQLVRIQIKTIRPRTDRMDDLVIYATDGKGRPYTTDHCDYLAGVHGADVYLIPCIGQREYWSIPRLASVKWRKITDEPV